MRKQVDLTKILQGICRKPENSVCADCNNISPSWASIDFGVLICLNCSGAHRALGPSITRVRSTRLDQWQAEWIPFLSLGNKVCNQYFQYNLNKNKKPCNNSSQEYINDFVRDKYFKKKYCNINTINPIDALTKAKSSKSDSTTDVKKQKRISSSTTNIPNEPSKKLNKNIFSTNSPTTAIALAKFQTLYSPQKQNNKETKQIFLSSVPVQKQKTDNDFNFDFSGFKNVKKKSFTDFSQSFPVSSSTNFKENKVKQGAKDQKTLLKYTFDDIFVKNYPTMKTNKKIDPFGIL